MLLHGIIGWTENEWKYFKKKDTTDTTVEKQFPKPLTVITHHAPAVVLYIKMST